MCEVLNKKLNYTTDIRSIRVGHLNVKSSQGKKSSLIFVDLADFEKLQTNIIDSQKLYESILLSNTMNAVIKLLAGFNHKQFTLNTAPYANSKLTRVIQALLQVNGSV